MSTDSSYPKAVDPDAVGTYPALAKAGGGYFFDDVLEYRVWIHPGDGDDHYFAFVTFEDALAFSKTTDRAERPLVLIRQYEYIDEPKPGVLVHVKGQRDAEWRVEWLADGKNTPGRIEEFLQENVERNLK